MRRVRVLHLLSNYKWTGPSEPAVALAAALLEEGMGVVLRTSRYTKGNPVNHLAQRAAARGIAPVTDLHLSKHRAPWRDLPDAWRLRRIVRDEGFDLLHCHLPNDTRIAVRALRGTSVPFVRTLYETELGRIGSGDLARLALARRVFVFSRALERELLARGLEKERLVQLEASIDLRRFRPGPAPEGRRAQLGLREDDVVFGIVARVQPQRRFDLLLDAVALAAREEPRLRLLVVGRGSKLERAAREPARQRGLLHGAVLFPGYFEGESYPELLRALDAEVFLVPGTDGTARAVREALASGLPVVATRRGILPELVQDGVSGRIVDETPQALAAALLELVRDTALRRRMGEAAARDARERFDLGRQVAAVQRAYGAALERAA